MMTLGIFAFTVTLWLFSRPTSHLLGGIKSFDALVGLFAVVLVSISGVANECFTLKVRNSYLEKIQTKNR